MLFNSLTFLVFFVVVTASYYLLSDWTTRKRLLMIASYLFYAAWNPPFVLLLLLSTSMDWTIARRMQTASTVGVQRRWLVASLCANLGLLSFFKYGQFLLDNFTALMGLIGVQFTPPASHIVLPVGISFYTFQSLSYTIDVYRRQLKADIGFADFALFVSFFPQLVAGPIVRAADFLPQLASSRRATADQFGWGLALMLFGLAQKLVLADAIFAPVADSVFEQPETHTILEVWVGVFAFSGQIFCDFAGYSLCAIGAALCLGFWLPENFRQPYAALGFSDFWRRWHLSLSTWLRDYLYIPLGGNRGGSWRIARNLMLTMLIGGLWHGASWLFVAWGGLHGFCLVVERAVRPWLLRRTWPDYALTVGRWLTFLTVSLIWIPFRAGSLEDCGNVLRGLLVTADSGGVLDAESMALASAALIALLIWQHSHRESDLRRRFESWPPLARTGALAGLLIAIFLVSGGDERAFIYFQF